MKPTVRHQPSGSFLTRPSSSRQRTPGRQQVPLLGRALLPLQGEERQAHDEDVRLRLHHGKAGPWQRQGNLRQLH